MSSFPKDVQFTLSQSLCAVLLFGACMAVTIGPRQVRADPSRQHADTAKTSAPTDALVTIETRPQTAQEIGSAPSMAAFSLSPSRTIIDIPSEFFRTIDLARSTASADHDPDPFEQAVDERDPLATSDRVEVPGAVNWRGLSVPAAETRFFEDFESDHPSTEWSQTLRRSTIDDYGAFAGPYRTTEVMVNLIVTPGQTYEVRFDLYVLAGALGGLDASDRFQIVIDGQIALDHRFEDLLRAQRDRGAPAHELDQSICRDLIVNFIAIAPIAEVSFRAQGEGEPGGEIWGIDNVLVDQSPDALASHFDEQPSDSIFYPGGGGGGGGGGAPFSNKQYGSDAGVRPNRPASSSPSGSRPSLADLLPPIDEAETEDALPDPLDADIDPEETLAGDRNAPSNPGSATNAPNDLAAVADPGIGESPLELRDPSDPRTPAVPDVPGTSDPGVPAPGVLTVLLLSGAASFRRHRQLDASHL